ncbi:MAG: permease-like cell division protein FtsX [Lamprobacter sp.]|uniref:permease-like cell division protein FtsX n=1 Tax=Lamprobacter sp. TaxID=3100796 RepID=UPI002B256E55|nr:permease-like cell division protein FtsX [Lamprobacter sp.]MEA3639883.1 permease-like cell division protein FtsX [Lamprobacter sp.]
MAQRQTRSLRHRQGNRHVGSSGLIQRRLSAWLEQHRETAISTLYRMLQQPLGTLMTLSAVAIALALPTALVVALDNVKRLGGDWQRSASVSVFLEAEIDEAQGAQLGQRLQQFSEVEALRLISRAEGLSAFRAYSGLGAALDQLSENPLPVVLELQLKPAALEPAPLTALIERIEALPEVDFLREDAHWAQRFQAILALVQAAVALLALLLGLGVLLVVGNSIRLEIENRRDEIRIMGLVGATPRFARRRFLYSGAWYGLFGGLLAGLLVTLMVWLLSAQATSIAAVYHKTFSIQGLGLADFGALLLGSTLLGIIGSWIAVGRHLDLCDDL